jgi:aspartate-semialdehyde dehydrogenase
VIVGASGAVGVEFLRLLEQRDFPMKSLKLLASKRSAGKKISFKGQEHTIEELRDDSFKGTDVAFFSAGASQSRTFAPLAVQSGCVVVDNSSAYRMDPNCPLVIPEINPGDIAKHKGIIANPNCSTIIMNMAVWPLHQKVPIERIVVSTYQAASGAGAEAMRELEQAATDYSQGKPIISKLFNRQYLWNVFSHNSKMNVESGYNEEEDKMLHETHKIFHDQTIGICATCIRVPVLRAHSESVNIAFRGEMSVKEAHEILSKAPGVQIIDDRTANRFPEPIMASGVDDVAIGRLREDRSLPPGKGLVMWLCGDQIRKGAALNAVQIAEVMLGVPQVPPKNK